MRIGLVCPYTWDIPGGVQYHVRDLAETLIGLGHHVQVLTPADDEDKLPPHVTGAGRAVAIRYNGSVARPQFGPVAAARVRRWLRDGHFDILHVHEPTAPSLSLLTCALAKGPIVATFHTATIRSRWLAALQGVLQPFLERIAGRIAVSDLARRVQVEHLGGDAIVIPNGVDVAHFASALPLTGYPRAGLTIGFLGRFDERRKGLPVLLEALALLAPSHPDLHLLIAGRGDESDVR
ncbi:MAG: glycosyltransferase family 4 protein, partial [Actinomycetota bacterium]|nr:glycosyltransferase family 4 protein [Actinomycetota bacterium]